MELCVHHLQCVEVSNCQTRIHKICQTLLEIPLVKKKKGLAHMNATTTFMSDSLCSDVDPPGNVQWNEQHIEHEHHVTDIE